MTKWLLLVALTAEDPKSSMRHAGHYWQLCSAHPGEPKPVQTPDETAKAYVDTHDVAKMALTALRYDLLHSLGLLGILPSFVSSDCPVGTFLNCHTFGHLMLRNVSSRLQPEDALELMVMVMAKHAFLFQSSLCC